MVLVLIIGSHYGLTLSHSYVVHDLVTGTNLNLTFFTMTNISLMPVLEGTVLQSLHLITDGATFMG